MERKSLTTTEVATLAGVSRESVIRWRNDGILIGFSTPGGHFRFPVKLVHKFFVSSGIPVDDLEANWIDASEAIT